MNVIWVSANRFGHEVLREALTIPGHGISALITLHPESKTKMYDGLPLASWNVFSLPVYPVQRLNDEVPLLKKLAPDLMIVCGWRQLIRQELLSLPAQGTIGFYPTKLPYGRGPAPIINSLLAGLRQSAVTLFYLSAGLDTGDIIGQEEFLINETDHASDVYEKVISAGKGLIRTYLPLLQAGCAPRQVQNEQAAVVFPKRSLTDNKINLDRESTEAIYRKIKAFSHPYTGAYIEKNGKKLIIWRAEETAV